MPLPAAEAARRGSQGANINVEKHIVSMAEMTLQVCEQVDFATVCKQHKENIRGQVQESMLMKQQDKAIQEDCYAPTPIAH